MIECKPQRRIILWFKNVHEKEFRVVAQRISKERDIEIFIEHKNESNDWVKVKSDDYIRDMADGDMTNEQIQKMLAQLSLFVDESFLLV